MGDKGSGVGGGGWGGGGGGYGGRHLFCFKNQLLVVNRFQKRPQYLERYCQHYMAYSEICLRCFLISMAVLIPAKKLIQDREIERVQGKATVRFP